MATNTIQISAHISEETKKRLDSMSRARGIKKAHLVEQALLHHMVAIDSLPQGFIIPSRLVLEERDFVELVQAMEADEEPTQALRDLFDDD